nr:uncharacterized protein LOC113743291 [Coffea arabica]
MDPLAFTKEDASGLQPYEQFQRLEHDYEALAAKKRKARLQAIPQGEVPAAKKPRQRQEDVSGATMEEIMELMNYGSRRRSRKVWYSCMFTFFHHSFVLSPIFALALVAKLEDFELN